MELSWFLIGSCIILLQIFDFTTGFHDTAIANTLTGFVTLKTHPKSTTIGVLLSGTLEAILHNVLTWWNALPLSFSYALIGELKGAVLIAVGSEHYCLG